MAAVFVIQGPDKGRSFELEAAENVVGRRSKTIQLSDPTISREHAKVVSRKGSWVLEDLGSANGTFLNGVRLTTPATIKRGDQIRCGASLLVFGGGPSPRSAVDVDEDGQLVDAAIVARMPSNEDSIIIPTPEAGAQAIGNLRILYNLISQTGSILNIDLLLRQTLDTIFETFPADRGYIMLIDDEGELQVKASRTVEGGVGQEIPISRTIINEVIQRQVGILSSNAMSDKRFASGKSVHDFGIRSAICVPIKGRDRILGVIHVDCSVSEHTYSTEQLRLLTAIGFQTGLALENVRLHESTVRSERLAAIGETTAVVSHHIKNILQALRAGVDVVEIGLNQGRLDKARQSWPIVQRNLERINQMILNMLAFSKDREPLTENVNINHLLKEVIELHSPQADERGVAIISDLDDVPPIPADPVGLHQVFTNLLANAIDAVSDRTGVITIASRYDSMNRLVRVSVSDNGRGIEPGRLGTIFDPFFSSKGQGGTGLGLAVARKLVREHRGRIDVKSTVDQGATFTVVLPAVAGSSADDTSTPAGPILR